MKDILNIITITKDDFDGLKSTISSTKCFRDKYGVRQIIVESSLLETQKRIKALITDEKDVTYIWIEPSGISSAFNLGLSLSKSEWIWFLNGGGLIHSNLDAEKLIYILKESNSDAIVFQMEFMSSHIRYNHPPLWKFWPPIYPNWIPHPAALLRGNLFEKFGSFNSNFKIAMDGEVWIKFFSKDPEVDLISLPRVLFDEKGISNTQTKTTEKSYKNNQVTLLEDSSVLPVPRYIRDSRQR